MACTVMKGLGHGLASFLFETTGQVANTRLWSQIGRPASSLSAMNRQASSLPIHRPGQRMDWMVPLLPVTLALTFLKTT
ncbi:hypothetical protein D3C80_2034090 [compost metagenome]